MYTIYINDCPLILCKSYPQNKPELSLRYTGKKKFFLQLADTLQSAYYPDGAAVLCQDVEAAWEVFQGLYKVVPAAGGVVFNKDRVLLIHRRGYWDIPKGKIDDGESIAEAALREVTEETGVIDLKLGKALPTSFHTYTTRKGKRVLKPTYWFLMESNSDELVPQLEEDIAQAIWCPVDQLEEKLAAMYRSLQPIVQAALAQHQGKV